MTRFRDVNTNIVWGNMRDCEPKEILTSPIWHQLCYVSVDREVWSHAQADLERIISAE
jgi:hypothetical protein